jgi:nucleotide sugar dehydrogenase
MKIGFIGQGFVGGSSADDFERRGYEVVRYALEEPYNKNKERVKDCDIVFIAVPTPTLPKGFDDSTVRKVLPLVGAGKIAVIKSTVLPGHTEDIQRQFPEIFVLHSPEFLSEVTATHDAAFPPRNIVGIPLDTAEYRDKAALVMSVLPDAPYCKICTSREAELLKYAHNCSGFMRIIFTNILFDSARAIGADWQVVQEAIANDPEIGPMYGNALHKSGRGAGGHCFIKDFKAFTDFYTTSVPDRLGLSLLRAAELKNLDLLTKSNKDQDLVLGVYGPRPRPHLPLRHFATSR